MTVVNNVPDVRIEFDDGQPVSQTWNRSEDGTAMFASDPRQFVAGLVKSKGFFIEYAPYGKVPKTLTFLVDGLTQSVDALDMDSFLRGLTREKVIEACGPGVEKKPDEVRLELSYNPTSSTNIGLTFEFSTFSEDAGKIISIAPIGAATHERDLKWLAGIHDQQAALTLLNSSPGLLTYWRASQGMLPKGKLVVPAPPDALKPAAN
jgi:hypothetical protein